jgi:hypothetical protein
MVVVADDRRGRRKHEREGNMEINFPLLDQSMNIVTCSFFLNPNVVFCLWWTANQFLKAPISTMCSCNHNDALTTNSSRTLLSVHWELISPVASHGCYQNQDTSQC